jgi:acetolactate synthase I/III small subunit
MEQIITGLIKNKPGVLATISDTFRDLDINITSLVVAETVDESISYITIVTDTTENKIDTIKDKLSSVMDIEKLEQLGREDHYERELLLVQVAMNQEDVSQIMQIAELFHAHVIGVGKHSITLEFVGETEQVKGFIRMMTPFGIKALARTGRTAVKKET